MDDELSEAESFLPSSSNFLTLEKSSLSRIVDMMVAAKLIKPIRRSNNPFILKILLGGGFGLLALCGTSGIWKLISVFTSFITGQTLIRLGLSSEEFGSQLKVRYNDDRMKVFRRVFGPQWWLIVVQVACCLYTGCRLLVAPDEIPWVLSMLAVRLIMAFNPIELNPFTMYRLIGGQHSGLFYGNSMAHSYFHGYLSIILPRSEHEDAQNFKERVEDYIHSQSTEDHLINFPDKRLYILFPSSGEAASKIADKSDGWADGSRNLRSTIRNRGGVKMRDYHNTVHRIKDPNDSSARPVYVVVEYATPLITYHEACKHFSSDDSWRSFKKDTVISFYETCQDILEQYNECKNMIRLVYYEDIDENGRDVNVAKVLLEAIKESKAEGQI